MRGIFMRVAILAALLGVVLLSQPQNRNFSPWRNKICESPEIRFTLSCDMHDHCKVDGSVAGYYDVMPRWQERSGRIGNDPSS